MSALGELRGFASYLSALYRYLREPVSEHEAIARIRRQLERRDESFLELLADGVFANPDSPYRILFAEAGMEHGDVVGLVRKEGLDAALERLYDAGVRVSLAQLRGQAPIGREGIPARVEHFDNPLARTHFEVRTGGSRSKGVPIGWNFAMVEYQVGYHMLLFRAHGVSSAPTGNWRPAPPGAAGLSAALTYAKLEQPMRRWFSQTDPGWRGVSLKHAILSRGTVTVSRLAGRPLPKPEYTPPERAGEVARWLAETKARASPALLATTPSAAVRICLAGRELELDISGTTFSLGGEPYTEARAAILAESGCRAIVGYYISELGGTVGMRCAASDDLDEVHLLTDKLAVVARNHHVGPSETVSALVFTTLHPLSPKLVINLESDDYGVLRRRDCGCPIEAAGFSLHFHGVRSYEKLTSEGNTFLGSDVITLLEEVLPGRFGGNPTDYQLVEWEEQALSKVAIVISPRVGAVDDREVIAAAIRFLRSRSPSHAMMADVWSQSDTLQVLRREPYTTNEKFQSVHVLGERVP